MNPRNFFDTSDVKFLKSRKVRKSKTQTKSISFLRLVYLPLSSHLLSGRFGPARLGGNDGIRTRSNCVELEHLENSGKQSRKHYELQGMVEVDRT